MKNDSEYGMAEVDFYLDFSRSPQETESLTGYAAYISALTQSDGDIEKACIESGLNKASVTTEQIAEPYLLGTAKVTKTQEKFLLNK